MDSYMSIGICYNPSDLWFIEESIYTPTRLVTTKTFKAQAILSIIKVIISFEAELHLIV